MNLVESKFSFESYTDSRELVSADAQLLLEARKVTSSAYAPYSHFFVGSAIRLSNGKILTGSNQENASFPAGLCAERVALAAAASQYPGIPVTDMALSYDNKKGSSNFPISPCGICRQSLAERENHQQNPIRLILSGLEGKVFVIPAASMLLPLAFSDEDLKGNQ